MKRNVKCKFCGCLIFSILMYSCNKAVQIPNPISSVTTQQTFNSDANATSALLGIYASMASSQLFSNSQTTYYAGESADELVDETSGNEGSDVFLANSLTVLNSSTTVFNYFWQPAYYDIYQANAVIAGVQASTGITSQTGNQLIGEAKFIRAFCYFYLTNLFGDLPLVLDVNFNNTVLLAKVPQSTIYQQIVSDLQDAQRLMVSDFSLSGGQPIRANKWAATAMLARVYLYQQNWSEADSAANAVINSGIFSLENNLNNVFAIGSSESIFQLQTPNSYPWSTKEATFFFVPYCSLCGPNVAWITPQLLNSFEVGDLRRINWLDSTTDGTNWYYCPYKYKSTPFNVGAPGGNASSGNITENYTLLRLAEQYLIRAEAEALTGPQQNLSLAIADMDTIRERAGLLPYSGGTDDQSVLTAIQHEKRIEFFAEWGHRWLDLKRWGIAISTLDTISYKMGNITSTQLLYPIPLREIQTDPNLGENPGYSY